MFEDGFDPPKAASCKHSRLLAFSACEGRIQSGVWEHGAGSSDCIASQRSASKITMEGEDHEGLALLPGTDFQDGVIEADIALKITTPPGVRYPGFVGIAFRVRPDASYYELFYVRPGNSEAADMGSESHALAEPIVSSFAHAHTQAASDFFVAFIQPRSM